MSTMWRSRWAAVGAAVAVTLGAGGLGLVHATTSSGEMPIYKPINPCRLADTRTAPFTVGPRSTPLGADESYTLSGWGAVGQCTLPSNTTALALNVTAISPSAATFLTLHPTGGDVPNASHLNPTPGEPPTPNAVNVDLNASGQFNIFNKFGNVNVIVDVVGYFDDHVHDSTDVTNEAGIARSFKGSQVTVNSDTLASSVAIRVPSDGFVNVNVTGKWHGLTAAATDVGECTVTKATTFSGGATIRLNDGNGSADGSYRGFSGHFTLEMDVADNPVNPLSGQSLNFVCDEFQGDIRVDDIEMTAMFFPTSYAPATLSIAPLADEAPPVPGAIEGE
jgi:hypothetical protein